MGAKVIGFHAIEEALKSAGNGSTLYVCRGGEKRNDKLVFLAKSNGKTLVKKLSQSEMEKNFPGIENAKKAVLVLAGPARDAISATSGIGVKEFCNSLKDGEGALVLVLDSITDPHNLGAILRSCDLFNVNLVITGQKRSASVNETVLRISSGAARYVKIATVTNLNREIQILKDNGFWVYGADMAGTSSYKTKFTPRSAIVMGSEGSGLSRLISENCDEIVSIPMSGHIDSLNVSVAAGILLYEVRRTLT